MLQNILKSLMLKEIFPKETGAATMYILDDPLQSNSELCSDACVGGPLYKAQDGICQDGGTDTPHGAKLHVTNLVRNGLTVRESVLHSDCEFGTDCFDCGWRKQCCCWNP